MKIIMVCLGNICRSPLAEGILQNKINKKGLNIEVDSAGTASYHIGEKPDIRSIEVAKEHGIDISNQRARQFTATDFDKFDIIFAMDKSNLSNIVSLASTTEEMDKIRLILNDIDTNDNAVPDPYYGGDEGFEKVYQLLDKACEVLTKKLTQ